LKQVLALAAMLVAVAVITDPVPAVADTVFDAAPPDNNYPLDITFRATITADLEITDVTLHFSLKNRGQSGVGKPEPFEPSDTVNATVVVDTNPNTNWLPVGNEFAYFWEADLADGSTVESEEQSFLYLPPEREWEEASNELVTVYYFGERSNTANRFLEAAGEVFAEVGERLLQTTLKHLPVKVVLFVTPEEIAESQPSKGRTVEEAGLVTCGYRPGSADDIIVVAASCGGGSSIETFRHEFGHIINAAAGESALVNLPAWMDEGLAVHAQAENDFDGGFRSAIRRGELLPFNRLNRAPSDPNDTLLFYGQSHAMVVFLLDNYGEDKLADLMSLTSSGTRFDIAFEQTYGMDMAAFEDAFRERSGLPPAATAGTPTPASSDPQPARSTPTPFHSPAASSGSEDGWDPVLVGTAVAAGMSALLAVFLLLLSQILRNRRVAAPTQARSEAPAEDSDRESGWGRPD